ncbi:pyridoxal phosphate-dependent transferase [Halteromyces radiatus]|uniref:pyridoxal phosphate-dependent transferase n=1 Tax=Halteromyces radiatus TaxID=101107 RepID=UPI00221EB457|nr:pyridoxal phosphate-dependent transferase [Halteromyces radiatus]KAI8084458.1 pyridoxal phosphate-dependent transferase [Halteromyces radiatus]
MTLYDLTSDTATQPTDEMFDIMKTASRGDDVFSQDTSVHELEQYMADLLGHEAALFGTSGTMTNQLGLRCWLLHPPQSVLCDSRAHVHVHECGGIAYHSQAAVTPVIASNGIYLTKEDVEAHISTDTLCGAPTKVISLENTLNGTIMPIHEIQRISELARSRGIKMHLDGARLFEASQATGVSMKEYGQWFDSVSVCLSKGAGAPIGSILVSNKQTIQHARHLRKLMGGGWRQAGMLAKAALHCIKTVVPTMPQTHQLTRRLADGLVDLGFKLVVPCHTNMLFIDFSPLTTATIAVPLLEQHNIKISNTPGSSLCRIVLHYQITSDVVDRFLSLATDLAAKHKITPSGDSAICSRSSSVVSSVTDLSSAYPSVQ